MHLQLYSPLRHHLTPSSSSSLVLAHVVATIGIGVHPRHRVPIVDPGRHHRALEIDLDYTTRSIGGHHSRLSMPGYRSHAARLSRLMVTVRVQP